jgi:GAF domain-containing protein
MQQVNWLKRLFSKDPAVEDRGFKQLVITVLGVSMVGAVLLVIADIDRPVMVGMSVILLIVLALAWRDIALPGRLLSPLAGLVVFGFLMFRHYGIRDTAVVGITLIVVVATLLIGEGGIVIYGALSLILVVALGIAESGGVLQNAFSAYNTVADYIVVVIQIIVLSIVLWLILRRLNESVQQVRRNEQAQIQANQELKALRASLQAQVDESTAHLRAAADVSRTVVSLLDPEQLLHSTVKFVQQRFGMRCVGLFRLEEGGQTAVLRASAGAVGDAWQLGYRVSVDLHSLIGECIVSRQVVKTEEAVKLSEIPGVHAGAVLPLQSRGEILGVLAVYTDRSQLLDDSLLSALTIVADQVVVALDNALLFERLEEGVDAERRVYGQLSVEAWRQLFHTQAQISVLSRSQGVALSSDPLRPEMKQALQQEEATLSVEDQTGLALPIKVRDQVIGVLGGRKPGGGRWTPEEIETLQTLTEQLGVALESARLYQDTQRRAARERAVGEVTGRMREPVELEDVLKVAVDEIRKLLDLDELVLRLRSSAPDKMSDSETPVVMDNGQRGVI